MLGFGTGPDGDPIPFVFVVSIPIALDHRKRSRKLGLLRRCGWHGCVSLPTEKFGSAGRYAGSLRHFVCVRRSMKSCLGIHWTLISGILFMLVVSEIVGQGGREGCLLNVHAGLMGL